MDQVIEYFERNKPPEVKLSHEDQRRLLMLMSLPTINQMLDENDKNPAKGLKIIAQKPE